MLQDINMILIRSSICHKSLVFKIKSVAVHKAVHKAAEIHILCKRRE